MKNLNVCYSLVAGLIVAAGCGGGAKEKEAGNLAIVNGEAITMNEFHSYLERKPTVTVLVNNGGGSASARVAQPLGFQAMRDLLNRRLLMQIAKDEGVFPNEAEVRKEIEFQQKANPNFLRTLTQQGMTFDEIKSDITVDLSQERILTKGVTVTDAEVDDFIKKNPNNFTRPPLVDLLWIVVPDVATQQMVDKDLRTGQSFRVVAARYSIAPNARTNSGAFPLREMNASFPEALKSLVDKTPEGTATGWVREGARFAKFYVERKTAAQKIEITDVVKTNVKRSLALQKGRQANDLDKRMEESLRNAKIEVKHEALKPIWENVEKNLNQEAKDGTETETKKAGN